MATVWRLTPTQYALDLSGAPPEDASRASDDLSWTERACRTSQKSLRSTEVPELRHRDLARHPGPEAGLLEQHREGPAGQHSERAPGGVGGRRDHLPDLDALLRLLDWVCALVRTPDQVARAAYAFAERQSRAGARYADVIFNPTHWPAWRGRLRAFVDALDAGFREAEQDGLPPVGIHFDGMPQLSDGASRIRARLGHLWDTSIRPLPGSFNAAPPAQVIRDIGNVTITPAGDANVDFLLRSGDWGVRGAAQTNALLQQLVYTITEEPGVRRALITQDGGKRAVIDQLDRAASGRFPAGALPHPLERPVQVAMLEAGTVLIQHRDLSADERSRLETLASDTVAVAPNPALPDRVIATAWRVKRECAGVDAGALRAFIAAHAGKGA